MAGMRVVPVRVGDDGAVDVRDLADKVERHADRLACVMITYPSTNGVFESTVADICKMVHEAGGQVYLDGANMNAMVRIWTLKGQADFALIMAVSSLTLLGTASSVINNHYPTLHV